MSCIITYKGQKYSEKQFKEYFINNKQEFVTSIAKNKNVIDSFKRKMEGIDYVFSQSPELASIGSKAQYLQYLSTIFKTSKLKDIVYHGSNQKINQFEIKKEPLIHFGSKNAALQRGDVLNQVLLNVKDLQTIKDGMWFLGTDEGGLLKELLGRNILTIEEVKSINEAKNKAIRESPYFHENYRMALPEGEKAGNKKLQEIFKDKNIGFEYINLSEDKGSTSYAIPSQEQIHILGSKQDIEGFKKYVNKNNPIQQTITDLFNDLEIKKCGPGGGLFKAADGMKPKGFTKGGTWKIVKDLKGYPTHAKGGVDLSIGKDGVKMHNGTTQITAAFGLVIPMAADGMVVPDGEDPTNPPKKKIPGLDRMIKDNTMFSESTNIVKPVVEFNQTIKPKKDIIDNIKDKLDPRNIGLNDMSNEKDFNSAYAKARKSGDEQFLYNGDRYNTNYKGTPAQQLKETGILDEQLGVNKVVRDKIYKNVTPYNSIMPPIMQGVKGLITTDKNRDINVENPLPITYKGKPEDFRKLSAKEQARYKEEAKPHFKRADDAWALYTGNPQRFNTFEVSNHKPSTSTDPKANYLSVSKSYPEIVDFVKKEGTTLKQGESKQVQEPSNLVFRNFKISKGKDEKGEYISYYDKWNLNPSLEFPIPEQGKPFEIYDRIYLNDSKKK